MNLVCLKSDSAFYMDSVGQTPGGTQRDVTVT